MFKTMKNVLIVKPAEVEKKTEGGLFIPDNCSQQVLRGIVVAASKESVFGYGDVVLFMKQTPSVRYQPFDWVGEPYIKIHDEEIIAAVREP